MLRTLFWLLGAISKNVRNKSMRSQRRNHCNHWKREKKYLQVLLRHCVFPLNKLHWLMGQSALHVDSLQKRKRYGEEVIDDS